MKLGNKDGSEGPLRKVVVKGRSKSISDGATNDDARRGVAAVAVLSLSLLLEEDGGDGDLEGGGTKGPASEHPLFRGGDLQLAAAEI